MVRSAYSLLQGTMSIERLVLQAKALGYTSVALTDRLTMSGIPEFITFCVKEGLHPIIGVELDFLCEDTLCPLICLAINHDGYHWLIRHSSIQNTLKTPLSTQDLIKGKEGVHFILPSVNPYFESDFMKPDSQDLSRKINTLNAQLPFLWIGITKQESAFYQKTNGWIKAIFAQSKYRCAVKFSLDKI